jgi:uncharacterized protein (DUF302 family)
MAYTFSTPAAGTYEEVVENVEAALAAEGFGVLSRIDVRATLKAKLDVDLDSYLILGACNPPLANRAIAADPQIGALLPCNVVVRGVDGGFVVDFMDPNSVLGLVDVDGIDEIASEVRAKLMRVKSAVAA